MDHHIEHLKDDLGIKEKLLCEVHATHKQLEKDIMSANERVNHLKEDYIHAKGRGDALEDEIKQLTQIVNDCDFEKGKQQMKYNAVVNERNILSTQLIHRNDELSILYEKIRIQQSTLSKGEAQYRDRLVDVRMLRDKVDNMRVSLRAAIDCIQNIDEMKQKVTTLQRFVLQERTKVKALYEELQNPMNVHRWRKMEGSAPKEMDNILKSQVLQKRLLIKVEECREKDLVIKNKENQYKQLKNILSRQPGPEIAEHLNIYHENLLKRAVQASNMEQHLSETRSQVTEYKDEADTLNRELVEVKRKFFGLKSKNRTLKREHMLVLNPYGVTNSSDSQWGTFPIRQPIDQPRFAGGGFALS